MRNKQGLNAGVVICAGVFAFAMYHRMTEPPPAQLAALGRKAPAAASVAARRKAARPLADARQEATPAPRLVPAIQRYTSAMPKIRISRHALEEGPAFDRKHPIWSKQSPAWQAQMKQEAAKWKAAGVGLVVLVHGTFVGKDPFGIVHLLSRVVPLWKPSFTKQLLTWNHNTSHVVFKDLGNWLPLHVTLLKAATGGELPAIQFSWSSRNDHMARVTGTLRLAHALAVQVRKHKLKGKRLLLLGHSHAGQLFALLSHLRCASSIAKPLVEIGVQAPKERQQLKQDLLVLRHISFDVVTMGTPPRYTWARCPTKGIHQRLLHIVNHRGKGHLGGSGGGVLTTRSGDYIQQWGIVGSDTINAIPSIFQANRKLEKYLGPGADPIRWYKAAKKRMRLHDQGDALLVDYRDQSKLLPNFSSTLLGHGAYTELRTLLFHLKLINRHLYASK